MTAGDFSSRSFLKYNVLYESRQEILNSDIFSIEILKFFMQVLLKKIMSRSWIR